MDKKARLISLTSIFLIIPLVVLILLVVSNPYFGNMDDSGLLNLARNNDPISYAHTYGWRPGYGYINDFSMLVTWPAYAAGSAFGAMWFYLVNSLVTYLVILVSGLLVARGLAWKGVWPLVMFVGVSFLWPYTAELLFFPSLQEKGVLLGAALLLGWTVLLHRPNQNWVLWLAFIGVTGAAFSTKTHILVYVPTAILLLWINYFARRGSLSKMVPIIATGVWLLLSLVTVWLTINGSYTSGTSGARDLSFLTDSRFLLTGSLTLAYATWMFGSYVLRQSFNIYTTVALVALVSVLGSFALWDLRNYYLAAFALAVAMAFGTVIDSLGRVRWKAFLSISVVLLACLWLVARLPTLWTSQGSVREFLESTASAELDRDGAEIAVSCLEAPVHFNVYAQDFGLSKLKFVAYSDSIDSVQYYLADSRLCPLFVSDPGQWQVVWSTGDSSSYLLYQRMGF